MRRMGGMEGLGSLVSESLRGLDIENRIKEQTCIMVWDEVVGEQVSEAAQPEYVRDGKLFVITKSSVWAGELNFYKADIMKRLNQRVGGYALKDIIFKAGRIKKRSAVEEHKTEESGLEGIQLTEAELERVESGVQAVGDEAGASMRRLLVTALKLEKWKKAQGWTPCKRCNTLQNATSGICPVCRIK